MKSDPMNTALKIVLTIVITLFAFFYALSMRYDFEVLGKSRDACLRLDKWTGKVELCPIDSGLVKKRPPHCRRTKFKALFAFYKILVVPGVGNASLKPIKKQLK